MKIMCGLADFSKIAGFNQRFGFQGLEPIQPGVIRPHTGNKIDTATMSYITILFFLRGYITTI
jgi:hypothetical protein